MTWLASIEIFNSSSLVVSRPAYIKGCPVFQGQDQIFNFSKVGLYYLDIHLSGKLTTVHVTTTWNSNWNPTRTKLGWVGVPRNVIIHAKFEINRFIIVALARG